AAPALEELREVCQPQAKLASRNGEHWAGRLYMRKISLHTTRQLVRTPVTPDQLTWTMVVCGVAAGAALMIPGLTGAILAVVLMQLFLLFDCVDGEVARWKGQNSAAGIYVDRLGAYLADAALLAGAGYRAAEPGVGGSLSVGIATALGLVLLEASLVLLVAAVADAVTGGIEPTRWALAALAVITWVMVPAHLLSILSSSRLRLPPARRARTSPVPGPTAARLPGLRPGTPGRILR